jgi:hypothetical protein
MAAFPTVAFWIDNGCCLLSRGPASTVPVVPGDAPFARLPDEVRLTRDEISVVLFALDLMASADLGESERASVRRAIRLITSKLWPELGDLLEDEG